jgi:hypothetical protein
MDTIAESQKGKEFRNYPVQPHDFTCGLERVEWLIGGQSQKTLIGKITGPWSQIAKQQL